MNMPFGKLLRGISGRTLVLVMGSILAFTAVLALLLFLGTSRILSVWHDNEATSLDSFIRDKLAGLALDVGRTGIPASSADVSAVLADIPYSPSYLAVASADGALLYLRRGMMMGGSMRGGSSRGMGSQLRDDAIWNDVRQKDGTIAFRFSAAIPAFDENESNRVLLGTARVILVWGLAIASIVAFAFAFVFARPLRKQSASLVSSLERMASGKRDVAFNSCSVTELDKIARASAVLQDNLVREESLRRQWAADVAHDLRTPLASLRGQIEGMIDGVFKTDSDRLVRLGSEISRLEALTTSLALLTRIETPGFAPSKKPVDLGSFLAETAARFTDESSESGSSVVVVTSDASGDGSCEGTIHADPGLLARAVDNLVSNALRYGKPGGTVLLSAIADNGSERSLIVVENEGVIDDQTLARAFDRLFRADSSRNTEGSGLGLSIAKAIVESHGGTIRGESDVKNNRTRFTISLP